MTRRLAAVVLCSAALAATFAHSPHASAGSGPTAPDAAAAAHPARDESSRSRQSSVSEDLTRIFSDPLLRRALVAVRVESLGTRGADTDTGLIFELNGDRLVMPASNMKLITIGAAAATLGWDYRFETRAEATGTIVDGTLEGDLIVTGTGDPTIGSPDGDHAPVFLHWADALVRSGIRRIDGRIIGDDDAFEDERLGAGWAWDDLASGYAAPVGALNYNDNAAIARFQPGAAAGAPAAVAFGPPGHGLHLEADVTTGEAGTQTSLQFLREPNTAALTIRGRVPAGGAIVTRLAAVDNPTIFLVEGLRLALASRGIATSGGAWDIDDVADRPAATGRRTLVLHQSPPLSVVAGPAMKASTNLYAEVLLRAVGRAMRTPANVEAGRDVVRRLLAGWGIAADELVIADGSGLSRYNYLTAHAIVRLLERVWQDEQLRGPFLALLPVAGRDGTLELRMRSSALAGNVQAKTGTISNARALSGFLDRPDGEKLVFSIVVNHYTAANAAIDAIVERALERLLKDD